MKVKIADTLIGLLLLLSSFESLHQYSNVGTLSVLFAVFYFVSGFAVFRAYSWARYILYTNTAVLLLVIVAGLYITNFEAWYIGIVPFVLALIFGAYGYFRYKSASSNKTYKKEAFIFVITFIAFSILSMTIGHFFWPSGNVMGIYRLK